ncbi:hypothetical protein PbJCM13498_32570 [Prolixibacter bellariivorans]|uniref:Uncharacterized protein n=1 Tax=Prolixibacter bellariivorans TaxID=314319 RepID=A0A5M4B2U0_9BACT|nr:hypothetical protein PbJCM13498_32570 [Prolixibacter bellariivorans]
MDSKSRFTVDKAVDEMISHEMVALFFISLMPFSVSRNQFIGKYTNKYTISVNMPINLFYRYKH